MAKLFTLAEAESLLPQIGRWIREAVTWKSEYQEAEGEFQELIHRIMVRGGVLLDRETAHQARQRRDRSGERLKGVLEQIQETGCVVKDLDIGLVDFPTLFRGSEVYLCWKMDEPAIRFWHDTQEGFAGRKPIDQDFLDHHEGEKPQ